MPASGWDNLVCRLGPEFLVRLPRRAMAAELVAHEQQWLPQLAGRLPLPVPAPVRVGRPTAQYPWPWSIVPFLSSQIAARSEPRRSLVGRGDTRCFPGRATHPGSFAGAGQSLPRDSARRTRRGHPEGTGARRPG
ncbi:phosphotransferase [Actinomadura rupiterrae]|uniref:phosphotransferase n=1 Tax=Actinomadura rupiterrae TaxID=559627 RepID=UPI0035587E4C